MVVYNILNILIGEKNEELYRTKKKYSCLHRFTWSRKDIPVL
jgi:hypothetical protein